MASTKVFALRPPKLEFQGIIRDLRVAWICEELNLPYELIGMDSQKKEHKTPEYLKIHPLGKVPAIQQGDGFALFESSAICTYLADQEKKLIPEPRTRERALYDQWMAFTLTQIEPHSVRIFAADCFWEKTEIYSKIRGLAVEALEPALDLLNKELSTRSFLLKEFSAVDVVLSHILFYLRDKDLVTSRKSLFEYLQRNFERPAFLKTRAKYDKEIHQ